MIAKPLARAATTVPARRRSPAPLDMPRTISSCARALLEWHGIDPVDATARVAGGDSASIMIAEVHADDGHLTMTLSLPMPYGDARMTVQTGAGSSIAFPGMSLSAAMTGATIGRPVGRLTGHPAFDTLDFLCVTAVRQVEEAGRTTTILSFTDTADAITGPHEAAARLQ